MQNQTVIHSNGSKWAGEDKNTIEQLVEILKTETIEERFFSQYSVRVSPLNIKLHNHCPISDYNGLVRFFGNFETLSHVFRIDTNDKELINKLSKAIRENEGWKKYYSKNLLS